MFILGLQSSIIPTLASWRGQLQLGRKQQALPLYSKKGGQQNYKSLVLALLALFLIKAEAAQVTHFTTTGDFAEVSWGDNGVISSGANISAQRSYGSTLLAIFSSTFDSTTGTITTLDGFGLVPDKDLDVKPPGRTASISVDLAKDGFIITRSVYDSAYNLISQSVISTGSINILLTDTGFQSDAFKGMWTSTSGNFTIRSDADRSQVAAFATGSFLNSALPSNASGAIGTNRASTITITKK
jgi:hypothetical protein